MKKILLALTIVLAFQTSSWSQCTPTWPGGGGPGISPDSATNLPHALEGVAYDAVVQFKTPLDTVQVISMVAVPITIENITITNVSGLSAIPSITPFTYVPNPANGVFLGGTVNCIEITGTPSAGSAGTYPISVDVVVNFHIQGSTTSLNQTQSVTFYKIVVDPNNAAPSVSHIKFDCAQNFPNPFSTKTNIAFNLQNSSQVEFKVYDLVGNIVFEKTIDGKPGLNTLTFDGTDMNEGVYFYSLNNGAGLITRRLIIDRK